MNPRALWAFIPLLAFLALAIVLARGLGRDTEAMPSPLVGQPVPDFALPALVGGDGELLTPEIFEGRWSLLNVWATWCPTCYIEHPYCIELARRGVAIVGINYKDDLDKARNYLANLGNPYTEVIIDERGTLAMDLGVYGAPETFVVDPEGRVRLRHAGEVNERVWRQKFAPFWEEADQ